MSTRPPVVRVVKHHVNCLPETVDSAHLWGVDVEYRGSGRWAVTRHGRCLSFSGEWDYESIPSERGDEWLEDHRFSMDEALDLAKKHAPLTRVNGYSVADVIEQELFQRKAAAVPGPAGEKP